MGALKAEITSQRDPGSRSFDAPRMVPWVYPDSLFSSGSSSCEKIAPSRSPRRLRRSTVDLSQIKSSADICPSPTEKGQEINTGANKEDLMQITTKGIEVAELVEGTLFHCLPLIQTMILVEFGLRMLFKEAHHRVGNILGFLMQSLFSANSRDESIAMEASAFQGIGKYVDEPPPDPPLSYAQVTYTPSSNPKDEWGHFADFQEELADDKFIFSCVPKTSSLETLEEDVGNEGDGDALSF